MTEHDQIIAPDDAPKRLKELGETIANNALERVGRGVARFQERTPLPYDLLESDEAFLIVFDAPGVRQKDLQVRFVDNEVRVTIDRFRERDRFSVSDREFRVGIDHAIRLLGNGPVGRQFEQL